MNSELASNDIRQAIDEAVRRYHTPHPKGATHIDKFDNYYKYDERWYVLSPFDSTWHGIMAIADEAIEALELKEL